METRENERLVHVNGVELCVETFGEAADPPLLLIMGSSASMDWWEDELCERLASGGRLVIRYDHRDTGRSVSYPPGQPGYGGGDLVADAAALLDVLDVARAHVVGMSMGGAIAQVLAIERPERVASLTLISTSPGGPSEADLPGMSQETIARFARPAPDWSDREAVIDHLAHLARVSASPSHPFDEAGFRELAGRVVDRTTSMASTLTNHNVLERGQPWRERLAYVTAPTLVVHGTDDPILPYAHGLALTAEITGARLLTLQGTGHEIPRRTWDVLVPAVLRHTAAVLT